MLKVKRIVAILTSILLSHSLIAIAQNNSHYYSPYPSQYYPYHTNPQMQTQPDSRAGGVNQWQNWMSNTFGGNNNQQGKGNIFQDAKGFYKLMGNGKTKYKFYFDFDVQMDAWMKAQNRANVHNRMNQNNHQYYNWNHQGQVHPGYQYRGQGYYQGFVYPEKISPHAPFYPQYAPQR